MIQNDFHFSGQHLTDKPLKYDINKPKILDSQDFKGRGEKTNGREQKKHEFIRKIREIQTYSFSSINQVRHLLPTDNRKWNRSTKNRYYFLIIKFEYLF